MTSAGAVRASSEAAAAGPDTSWLLGWTDAARDVAAHVRGSRWVGPSTRTAAAWLWACRVLDGVVWAPAPYSQGYRSGLAESLGEE